MSIYFALGLSLVLTLVIEITVALFWGIRDRKDILLVILVNILTNPVVVLCYWMAAGYTELPLVLVKAVLEVGAFLIEFLCYNQLGKNISRPLLLSLVANAVSFGIGELINFIL